MFETTGYDDPAGVLGDGVYTYRKRLAVKIPNLMVDVFIVLKGYDNPEGILNDWPDIEPLVEVSWIKYIEDLHRESERILKKLGRLPPEH